MTDVRTADRAEALLKLRLRLLIPRELLRSPVRMGSNPRPSDRWEARWTFAGETFTESDIVSTSSWKTSGAGETISLSTSVRG